MVAVLAVPAMAASTEERRLTQTRQQVAAVRAQLESARGQAAGDAAALAEAEAQLNKVLQAVGQAEQAVQRQQQAVEEAREELADLRQRAMEQRRLMSGRAVNLYMQGTSGPVDALMAAESPQDAMRRTSYIDLVASADRRNLEGVSASGVAVDAQRDILEKEEVVLARVLDQQRTLHAEVEDLRNDRALVFASSSQQVAQLESQERHLEAEGRQLATMARRAAQQRAAAERASRTRNVTAAGSGGPVPNVGGSGWVWPASGPVTSEYGPRWGRMHQGIDIGAPHGAAIVAARAGTVSSTGTMGGYGSMTMIDHGGGIVTAYAHQSAIAVSPGQSVSAGQRIGSIGCSGSCTGPHLHFEVRVNGSARNPRGYLP